MPIGPTVLPAPWTAEQVTALNWHQRAGQVGPLTCGRRAQHPEHHGVLVAEVHGWRCPADGCDYWQKWALPFMAEPPSQAAVPTPAEPRSSRTSARACLLHEDIHTGHGWDCKRAYVRWLTEHPHIERGPAARDAYALEVERRILDRLIREHAPAHRINPALTK